jgi:hypothetical protein
MFMKTKQLTKDPGALSTGAEKTIHLKTGMLHKSSRGQFDPKKRMLK